MDSPQDEPIDELLRNSIKQFYAGALMFATAKGENSMAVVFANNDEGYAARAQAMTAFNMHYQWDLKEKEDCGEIAVKPAMAQQEEGQAFVENLPYPVLYLPVVHSGEKKNLFAEYRVLCEESHHRNREPLLQHIHHDTMQESMQEVEAKLREREEARAPEIDHLAKPETPENQIVAGSKDVQLLERIVEAAHEEGFGAELN